MVLIIDILLLLDNKSFEVSLVFVGFILDYVFYGHVVDISVLIFLILYVDFIILDLFLVHPDSPRKFDNFPILNVRDINLLSIEFCVSGSELFDIFHLLVDSHHELSIILRLHSNVMENLVYGSHILLHLLHGKLLEDFSLP